MNLRHEKENHKVEIKRNGIYIDNVRLDESHAAGVILSGIDEAERSQRYGNDRYKIVLDMRDEVSKDGDLVMDWNRKKIDSNVRVCVFDMDNPEDPKLLVSIDARKYMDHKDADTLKETLKKSRAIDTVYFKDIAKEIDEGRMSASWSCVSDSVFGKLEDGDEKGSDIYAGIVMGDAVDDLTVAQFIEIDDDVMRWIDSEKEHEAEKSLLIEEGDRYGAERSFGKIDWSDPE